MTDKTPEELANEFKLDENAHNAGKCSFPVLSLCAAEEQRVKLFIIEAIRTEREARQRAETESEEIKKAIESIKKRDTSGYYFDEFSIISSDKFKEFMRLEFLVRKLAEVLEYMASFSPHCCEDCPCDEFRQRSEQALAEVPEEMR